MKKSVLLRSTNVNKSRVLYGVLGFLLVLGLVIPLATGASLQEIGRISIPGQGRMLMHVDGDYVYVARYGNPKTFGVVNVSDKSTPWIEGQIGDLPNFSNVHDLWYSNGYAYTAHRSGGVNMINVSDPVAPYVQDTVDTNYTHRGIMSVGDYLYVAEHSVGSSLGGMRIFDVSGGSLNQVGDFFGEIDGRDLAISSDGQYAYQSTPRDDWGPHALYTFNVSDKSKPTVLSSIPNIYGDELLISPDDRYLYMTYVMEPDHWGSPSKGIKIYDLTDPALPSEIATISLLNAEDIALDHNRKLLYVRLYAGDPGIYVFDVHDPSKPTQLYYYPLDSAQSGDLFYYDNYVYAVEGTNDLVIFKAMELVNDMVDFTPIRGTYGTIPFTNDFPPSECGCPDTSVGLFHFQAVLENTSNTSLTDLTVKVHTLTNDNLLVLARGNSLPEDFVGAETGGEGALWTLPASGNYHDGILDPTEAALPRFGICLKEMRGFDFWVDVLGTVR